MKSSPGRAHRELKRWQGFLDDEAPGTKGLHFCTDANLKALPGLKLDQAQPRPLGHLPPPPSHP